MVQSFSAHMPLLTATRTLGRRHWRSPQQCYPHRLCTCIAGNWWITVRANHAYRDKLTYKQCKCFWCCYHNHSHCKSSPGSFRLGAGWPMAFRPRQPTCPVGCCCPHLLGQKSKLLILSECVMPSVLWHCWLGGRKGIRPVKNWVVRCWRGYLSAARCRLAYAQLMPLPLTVSLLQ